MKVLSSTKRSTIFLWVIFILAITTPAVALPHVIAGPIVSPINGNTYYLLSTDSWTNSESQAESMGGHLATIRSAAENTWAYNTFSLPGDLRLWIGFEDAPPLPLFDFVWADGEPVTYTNWAAGEPNNYEGIEFYAYIIPPDQGIYAAHWNDTSISGSTVGPVNGLVEVENGPVNNGGCQTIDFSQGFTTAGLSLNGGATISGSALELTDGGSNETRSAFFSTAVPVGNFVTDFTFQLVDAQADGFAFVVQTNSPGALGGGEGGLGYVGIPNSAALKFDLFSNYGEGRSSTGFFLNGAYPAIPSIDLLSKGVDLHSGHIFAAHGLYNAPLATVTLTDTVTKASVTLSDKISLNAPGGKAYVGFTGGTGHLSATQNILTWSFSGGVGCTAK